MTETVDLQKTYNNSILKKLSKELGDLNVHSTPRLEKIVLNIGVGKIVNVRRAKTTSQKKDEELLSDLAEGISLISGQKPSIVHAHKSIAGFKLREGDATGLKVTLRKQLMYDFLARLIHIALPRTRDFRGISEKSVDKNGNLTVGVKEASIFPELPSSSFAWGFETTMVTKANGRVDALKLFKELGVPFKK
ncbi:MAG: 50S ribosomal protein L5 [Candidatus Spechtbacteria bacterium RIFCSPLOWO2_12_FULL_38_22]|uniref:Large ribosomal subunit protein uL5 n=1 Tax=Candidatus Spechtbacteria bacterium RIFCSPLOWO2_12_FULL_38_22 TaxID=1802165 RepID=A0A1G2HI49_9BACT|nr:MAG: 50S ribosomal protein L5 [Candidatus Spechtbacteria bacterium RIFCSPHIGHO2_01_FULL_38_11]OGZ59301.1 MAG: 50S ribosomal protein L5 [Candidatus Spechtbacteria bacterium RIFCSPHIGHO2_12_FULL_38_30]OGZ60481.1 MAG: 50S ribosomal protein L5 [Candidatus Spechtbacteria bacterium RIFCSPLOWO2_01_FULL_38_20]OGZ62174.1 MAG: 50S ribosomal protein L5 [Candidatus Spechtbacteria bacterium RIFCSPLOWO2_12_FULL_38_22]